MIFRGREKCKSLYGKELKIYGILGDSKIVLSLLVRKVKRQETIDQRREKKQKVKGIRRRYSTSLKLRRNQLWRTRKAKARNAFGGCFEQIPHPILEQVNRRIGEQVKEENPKGGFGMTTHLFRKRRL